MSQADYTCLRNEPEDVQGTKAMSDPMLSGTQQWVNVSSQEVAPVKPSDGAVHSQAHLEFEFFDKEEQKRREEYRNRVEKHYCRLIEEERLSPESASFLSDAFAEAEVRAKFGTVHERSEATPMYHTGIDKTVWREIDHQRSKSLERLKSQQKDMVTDNNADNCDKSSMIVSLNMDSPGEFSDFNKDFNSFKVDESGSQLMDSGLLDSGQFGLAGDSMETYRLTSSENGIHDDVHSGMESMYENEKEVNMYADEDSFHGNEHDQTNVTSLSDERGLFDDDTGDLNDVELVVDESSETLNMESEEEQSDSEYSEFDLAQSNQREWVNSRGARAVGKSMETWLDSPQGGVINGAGQDRYYRDKMDEYKRKLAVRERGKITQMLKQSSSIPSASPTPVDYDADVEVSTRDVSRDNTDPSLDQWSDSQEEFNDRNGQQSSENNLPKQSYDFNRKFMSSRSSLSSEKNRVDPLTYQSYTAGLLHSSGKSEKFLKLQKHFAVLERITAIEDQTRLSAGLYSSAADQNLPSELYAKYDVQSMEELQWLYQELGEARKNEEFFYDLQKLAVYHWTPTRDYGLKKRGKSLNDLKKVYEQLDDDANNTEQNSFFQSALKAEKERPARSIPATSPRRKDAQGGHIAQMAKTPPKVIQRPLYGTHIPEKLDEFEIKVEARKQKTKVDDTHFPMDNLHVRSISSPYSKHLQEADGNTILKRSDSSKGSLFAKRGSDDRLEQKMKPTGEVTPVPRQSTTKHQPHYPKILSGPHDFASRASNNSEAVARPMQSNLQIYNSLENPQYQATVTFDEGIPARKLSRGRSNDSFIIQRDSDGNYIVSTAERNQNRSPQGERSPRLSETDKPSLAASQSLSPLSLSPRTSRGEGENPLITSTPRVSRTEPPRDYQSPSMGSPRGSGSPRVPMTERSNLSKIPLKSESCTTKTAQKLPPCNEQRFSYPSKDKRTEDDTPAPPLPARNRRIDRSHVSSVKAVVKTFENSDSSNDNYTEAHHQLKQEQFRSSSVPRSHTVPDLLDHQTPVAGTSLTSHDRQKSNSDDLLASSVQTDFGKNHADMLAYEQNPGMYAAKPLQANQIPNFKVRDLRYLAYNNELCNSKFYPKKSPASSLENVRMTFEEPRLYSPVRGKVFQSINQEHKTAVPTDCESYVDKRRHSTSSTDTFIVKESEDEGEFPPLNVTYTKGQFVGSLKSSKSVPNLSDPTPSKQHKVAARSTANPKPSRLSDSLHVSGRHCIPKTVCEDQNDVPNTPWCKPSASICPPPRSDSKRLSYLAGYNRKYTSVLADNGSHLPSEEIVKDVMQASELYKRTEPKEKPRTPTIVNKMTLEYLQEIGQEWLVCKTRQTNKSNKMTKDPPVLPRVEPFVGSDLATTPNRWEPVLVNRPANVPSPQAHKHGKYEAHEPFTIAPPDVTKEAISLSATAISIPPVPPRRTVMKADISEYEKYLTLPRRPKAIKGQTYNTIPRMRPDNHTNKAREAQNLPASLDTGAAFHHLTTEEIRSQQPRWSGDRDQRRREEEESYRKRRLEQIYDEERRKKLIQQQADNESRKHSDFLLSDQQVPSQKSPIPNDRFEEPIGRYGAVPEDRRRGFQIQGKARGLYNFTAQNNRELPFRKGDTIYLIRQIDANWFEGEKGGRVGIFPVNYVEILTSIEEAQNAAQQSEGLARAKYSFTSQTSVELSLRKGETVTLLRKVDDNWFEGRHGAQQGIFPVAYVEVVREPSTPLVTPAPSVICTPMTGRGTPEMLSPMSYDGAPTPPPMPSPGAFKSSTLDRYNGSRYGSQQVSSPRQETQYGRDQFDSSPANRQYSQSPAGRQMNGGYSTMPNSSRRENVVARSSQSPQIIRRDNPPTVNITAKSVSSPNIHVNSHDHNRNIKQPEEDLALARYRAVYAYKPQNEDELELLENDEVYVMEKCDDGWYVGTSGRTGMFGTFPGNYVTRIQ
ncbi:uncharacterized protein LOC128208138 isoform X21 [Mya arenaria]|uniref:uncharacterized protein LOC128208138 isoform X21 n=1 Tax=Mya arenaria TaxID=6604 RepID=UPI0022E552E9|nr:uncharacterized protein LOC128208138 isoform X21 [Mya arenaria]